MILVLTGPIHSGKTSLLESLVRELRKQGIGLEGFLSPAVLKDGELAGYDLFDLKEEKTLPYIRKEGSANGEKVGPYFFIPEALETARKMILRRREQDFLIIDEAGPLEIHGGGIWPALHDALSSSSLHCLLVVRRNILDAFRDLLKPVPLKIFDVENPGALGLLLEEIRELRNFEK
jgi:nucleoside-triphosphatase THEP1